MSGRVFANQSHDAGIAARIQREETTHHMYRETELRDPLHSYTPRAWLTLVGASALILSAAGIAQATKVTNSGTAIPDAGNGSVVVNGNRITSGCINQMILSTIAGGGSEDASWSATFTPVSELPEPESFLLLGAGLTAIGLFKRNARKS
jgi:hypothetical protein